VAIRIIDSSTVWARDEPQALAKLGQIAPAALGLGRLGAVGRRRNADGDGDGRYREGGGIHEQHVGGADGRDQDPTQNRPYDLAQAHDRPVGAVGPLDRHPGAIGQERHQGVAGRVTLGVHAREHEYEHDQLPELENTGQMQYGHGGHHGRAGQVGQVLPATGGARNILDAVKGPGRTQC
jgi:hypothetical protein